MSKAEKFQEVLRKNQPVAWQILKNALEEGRTSHAYIFSGPKGTGKKEAAYLLAQSLVCENRDPFACEECEICHRIRNGSYVDLIYVDGHAESIKTEHIERILDQFQKTGAEIYNRKIYILDGAEFMTQAAQNKMLKFIEEPSDSVSAILLTEQKEKLLPTILSRCQVVEFLPLSVEKLREALTDDGFDPLDAYLLSHIYKDKDDAEDKLNAVEYTDARMLFSDFLDDLATDKNLALIHLQSNPVVKKKRNKPTFRCFTDMLAIFFSDLVQGKTTGVDWYDGKLDLFRKTNYNNAMIIHYCQEAQSRLSPDARENMTLVLDQLVYRL